MTVFAQYSFVSNTCLGLRLSDLPQSNLDSDVSSSVPISLGGAASKDVIDVVTATDEHFTPLPTMLASLDRHHEAGEVRVTILMGAMGKQQKADLKQAVTECCPKVEVVLKQVEHLPDAKYQALGPHISSATMLRLLIPEVMEDIRRIIWLDADLIVRASLRSLWNGTLCQGQWETMDSPGICARSTNSWSSTLRSNSEGGEQSALVKTFNAGVMMWDLKVLRHNQFHKKMYSLTSAIATNDQTALNTYANGMHAELDAEWNAVTNFPNDFSAFQDPKIVHYAGPKKPWICGRGAYSHYWANYSRSPCAHRTNKSLARADSMSSEPIMSSVSGGLMWVWNSEVHSAGSTSGEHILVVWSSVADLPDSLVDHARFLVQLHSPREVQGLCATAQCVKRLSDIGVLAERIKLRKLVLNTLLKNWFADNVIHKIRAGQNFEYHFQQAVVLAALYQRGGLYFDLQAKPLARLPDAVFSGEWSAAAGEGGMWTLCRAPPHARSIYDATRVFVQSYAKAIQSNEAKVEYADIDTAMPGWNPQWGLVNDFLAYTGAHDVVYTRSFGTLSMDKRTSFLDTHGNHAVNLGDEVQGFVGLQFLPHVNFFIDRDDLAGFSNAEEPSNETGPAQPTLVFLNAWYGTPGMTWPPSSHVDPVLNSFHFEQAVTALMSSTESVAYLNSHGGVGARDEASLELLRSWGVEAEFTGCMTLLFQGTPWVKRFADIESSLEGDHHGVYIVDTPEDVLGRIGVPQKVLLKAQQVTNHYEKADRFDKYARYDKAFALLAKLRRARLVITSRLHSALPSVAMGVPVIFVKHNSLLGGYDKNHDRIAANFSKLFHMVDLIEDKNARLSGFDFSHPPRNPGGSVHQNIMESLLRRICSKPYIIDYFAMFADEQMEHVIGKVDSCRTGMTAPHLP